MPIAYKKYKEAKLHNNCPECYATDGLMVSFSQKVDNNKLYTRSTSEVKAEMHCANCDTVIYPARWTDDIERVYEYNRKLAEPPKPFFRFKWLSLFVVLGTIAIGVALAFLILKYQ